MRPADAVICVGPGNVFAALNRAVAVLDNLVVVKYVGRKTDPRMEKVLTGGVPPADVVPCSGPANIRVVGKV